MKNLYTSSVQKLHFIYLSLSLLYTLFSWIGWYIITISLLFLSSAGIRTRLVNYNLFNLMNIKNKILYYIKQMCYFNSSFIKLCQLFWKRGILYKKQNELNNNSVYGTKPQHQIYSRPAFARHIFFFRKTMKTAYKWKCE